MAWFNGIRLIVTVEDGFGIFDGVGVDFRQIFEHPFIVDSRRPDIFNFNIFDLHVLHL